MNNNTAKVITYKPQDAKNGIRVRCQDNTLWLTQKRMAKLFGVKVPTINEHLKNIFTEGELEKKSVIRKFRITATDGKKYNTQFYNLDAIISVGYRADSKRATHFRKWARKTLAPYSQVEKKEERENNGWTQTILEKQVLFLDNKRVPIKQHDRAKRQGIFPYYGASGIIDYINDYLFDDELILLAEDGANIISRSTPIAFRVSGKIWVNNHAHVLKTKDSIDIDYLCFYLDSLNYEKYNTSSAQPKLNRETCEKIPLNLPPLKEQKAIASTLELWDTAIEKTERLIAAKEQQFKYLLKTLINDIDYPKVNVSYIAKEQLIRNNKNSCDRVLSVTNHSGFILPEQQFGRRVASLDLRNYKIVKKYQYGYNPARINVGSIARLEKWEIGVLSPMYIIFNLNELKINNDFFLYWLETYEAKKGIALNAKGSVRKTVDFEALGRIEIALPDMAYQKKAATTLSLAKQEITTLQNLAEKYRTQKRGLMQKLLTEKTKGKN